MLAGLTLGIWMDMSRRVLVRVAVLRVERIRFVMANASRLREPVA